jgi:drug/metabolite transporter (DMT)-like permease
VSALAQWIAVIYLGVFGGAAAFFLWVLALRMTTPTRVASTMTVNPVAASLLAAILVSEPIGWNLVVGLIAVALGIWVAATIAPARGQDRLPAPVRRQSCRTAHKKRAGPGPCSVFHSS